MNNKKEKIILNRDLEKKLNNKNSYKTSNFKVSNKVIKPFNFNFKRKL